MNRLCKYGLCAGLLATLLIGGCGIKPSHLDPPQGRENSGFPHKYPQR